MAGRRTLHAVLLKLGTVSFDVTRLASAIEVIGARAKVEGLEPAAGGGIEVPGEVMSSRAGRLGGLLSEASTLSAALA